MNALFSSLQCIFLLVTIPLEPINITQFDLSDGIPSFVHEQNYIAAKNGTIEKIDGTDDDYQIHIRYEDSTSVVYSGLSELDKIEGEKIYAGDIVGRDETISKNTKYVVILYETSNLFPQFSNAELVFPTSVSGKILYAMVDGTIKKHGFDPSADGTYIDYDLFENKLTLRYMHLSMSLARDDVLFQQGNPIAVSGVTGVVQNPRLAVRFISNDLTDDFRAIYLHPRRAN